MWSFFPDLSLSGAVAAHYLTDLQLHLLLHTKKEVAEAGIGSAPSDTRDVIQGRGEVIALVVRRRGRAIVKLMRRVFQRMSALIFNRNFSRPFRVDLVGC